MGKFMTNFSSSGKTSNNTVTIRYNKWTAKW